MKTRCSSIIAAVLLASCSSLNIFQEQSNPQAKTFHCGYMYWAPDIPILHRTLYVVLKGRVKDIWKDQVRPGVDLVGGSISIDEIMLNRPVKQQSFGNPELLTMMGGMDGLKPGDKVVGFITEYDGGYAVQDAMGSNCKLGIKVSGDDDPIIDAVRKTVNKDRQSILKDKSIARIWRKYDDIGVEAELRNISYLQVCEERDK